MATPWYQRLAARIAGPVKAASNPVLGAMIPVGNTSARWTTLDYSSAAREGYGRNPYVYAAISQIATTFAGIRWTVYESEDKDKELKDHPLATLLKRPNPRFGHSTWFETYMGYLLLDGNAFIYAIGPQNGPPTQLHLLRPDRMEVVTGSAANPIAGYIYRIAGQKGVPIPEPLVRHIKLWNPLDELRGMSPLSAAAMSVDQSNASKTWNVGLLQNSARPPGAMIAQAKLDPASYERLNALIRDEYTGFINAGKPLLLESGLTWQEMGISPKDMDWLEGQKLSAREIAIVFNIAPELLADSANKTYSNYGEARVALYQENALPKSDVLRDELNAWLSPLYDDEPYIDYVKDDIEALQEDQNAIWDRVGKAFTSGWITINDARGEVNLDEDKEKGDQYSWEVKGGGGSATPGVGAGGGSGPGQATITEEQPPALPPGKESEQPATQEGQTGQEGGQGTKQVVLPFRAWTYPDQKAARTAAGYLTETKRARARWIKKVQPMIANQYKQDRETLRQSLKATNLAGAPDHIVSTLTGPGVQQDWVNLYADITMVVGYDFAGNTQNHMADRFDLPIPKYSEDDVRQRLAAYMVTRVSQRVHDMLTATARRIISDYTMLRGVKAIVKPGSIDTLDDLEAFLDDIYIGFTDEGAQVLAEHEVNANSNIGQFVGASEMGNLGLDKVWMTVLDDRTRKWHAQMDGVAVGLDEFFDVDGESMLYPLDDANGATGGNLYGCRCTTYYQPAGV